ncbi:hypothetical protein TWF694_002145 [Orbilia ellipsospora]|uniref:RRM domain-containing protein n=1 Tax=Orbilia ellipsospora TaxID=2528407 RepID=A0AAV9X4P3_9PEZI
MPVHFENPHRPVYCFVEFYSVQDTEAVRGALNGRLMRNRPIRIDISRGRNRKENVDIGHQNDAGIDMSALSINENQPQFVPNRAQEYGSSRVQESTRLFVGGLPHVENINELEDLMTELFNGFHIESLSGIFSSKKGKFSNSENSSYCFVDLVGLDETRMAIQVLNNRQTSWGIARVNYASGGSDGRLKYRGVENQSQQQNGEAILE